MQATVKRWPPQVTASELGFVASHTLFAGSSTPMKFTPIPAHATPSRLSLYLDLIRWDRPAGSYLLLWPTFSALWIAAKGFPGWHLLLVFTAGTFLMRSAGCAVNDVADREVDRHVKRTAQRPVTPRTPRAKRRPCWDGSAARRNWPGGLTRPVCFWAALKTTGGIWSHWRRRIRT